MGINVHQPLNNIDKIAHALDTILQMSRNLTLILFASHSDPYNMMCSRGCSATNSQDLAFYLALFFVLTAVQVVSGERSTHSLRSVILRIEKCTISEVFGFVCHYCDHIDIINYFT